MGVVVERVLGSVGVLAVLGVGDGSIFYFINRFYSHTFPPFC